MSDDLYFVFVQQSAWWASGVSLFMMWQMGNRRPWAPWVGLVGQVFWLMLAVFTQQWGLAPAVVAYSLVHIHNGLKWRSELPS